MTAQGEHTEGVASGLGECLKAAGWRQGSFVRMADINTMLAGRTFSEEACCLVVSQSCDLLHCDSGEEPYVDCLVGFPLAEVNGNFTARKNPRRLHIQVTASGVPQCAEFRTSELLRLDRNLFDGLSPDESRWIDPRDLRTVTDWLAARYVRAAFPDAFNDRRVACREELKKALKGAKDVAGLYIALSTFEELKPGDPYGFMLLAILKGAAPTGKDVVRDRMQTVVTRAAAALSRCDGIEERKASKVVYESEITLQDASRYVRFEDYDYVSVANPGQHSGPFGRI